MWSGFSDGFGNDGWLPYFAARDQLYSLISNSNSKYEKSESDPDAQINVEKLEAEFNAARQKFYTKDISLNAKIQAFDAFINSTDFQNELNRVEHPRFISGAYYFKALAHSRIKTTKSLEAALIVLGNIDTPSAAHRILQGECLEKLGRIQEAKDIFRLVERSLLHLPAVQRQSKSYQSSLKRISDFNGRHDVVNEATGLTPKEEQEGFKVQSFTPFKKMKQVEMSDAAQNSSVSQSEDPRYAVSVSNRFNILRK